MRTNGFIAWSCQLLLKQKGGSLRHVLDFLFFPCMWISLRSDFLLLSPMFLFASSLSYRTVICHPASLLDFILLLLKLTPLLYLPPPFFVFCFPACTFEDLFKPFLCVSFVFPGCGNTLLHPTPSWPWDQLWKVLSTLSSRCKYTETCVE